MEEKVDQRRKKVDELKLIEIKSHNSFFGGAAYRGVEALIKKGKSRYEAN
jgi:hypothetical protein